MLKLWNKFIRSEDGATAIEYGLIAAGIAVAIAAVVFTVGDSLTGMLTGVSDKIDG
jgi:pilus assembly protein Flp/PilA